ncbi:FadR/GntR family transcriptional regulator [Halodesulfovibrio aestuarii]|uniref:DNA-binding transcriptional regulator, FadR family n=1 Tax=Halodesulfovibrio aestuarii TaxID=126333 RepID=A0A8G2C903_9BACT|nr:GntR family transcriptional regulator [Halodesulfovibrio aestuarii]SHJ01683.1 DNA-binding transcriptional regulator, FadR family [Halodesulfovibrio aestuarii]
MTIFNDPPSLFIPVQAGRASEEVALQIEAAIVDGRLSPGERLPSEREMQSQFGTGRGVIREAIKVLKQKGLLEVKKGSKGGAYIRRIEVDNVSESLALFLKQHPVEPEKLIEFREVLDRTITQLVIAHASQRERDDLMKEAFRLEAMLKETEPDLIAISELDRQLNIMLARMGRNPLFEWVMHAIQRGFSSYDYALYDNKVFREKAAANWSDTARAIAKGELMRALAFVGHHYVLLRQCIDENAALTNEPDAPFLQEDEQ